MDYDHYSTVLALKRHWVRQEHIAFTRRLSRRTPSLVYLFVKASKRSNCLVNYLHFHELPGRLTFPGTKATSFSGPFPTRHPERERGPGDK